MYVIYLNWSDIVYGWLRKIVIPVFMASHVHKPCCTDHVLSDIPVCHNGSNAHAFSLMSV